MQGFDGATPRRSKSPRMGELVDLVEWPEGDYEYYRPIGPVYSVCQYWFRIGTPRKPQGVSIPKDCLDHDGATDKMVGDECPFRASGKGRESKKYYINVISRSEQEGRKYPPLQNVRREKHLGYEAYWGKAGDSRKTPVRVLEIPDSQISRLQSMKKMNKVKHPRTGEMVMFDISDERFGCDIGILFDPTKQGPAKYDIQKGERTPITREERNYLMYRLDLMKPMSLSDAKQEMADLASKLVDDPKKTGDKAAAPRGGRGRNVADDELMEGSTGRLSEEDFENDDRGASRDRGRGGRDDARGRVGDDDAGYDGGYADDAGSDDLDRDFADEHRGGDRDRGGGRERAQDREDTSRRAPRETRARSDQDDYGRRESRSTRDRDDQDDDYRSGSDHSDADDYGDQYDSPGRSSDRDRAYRTDERSARSGGNSRVRR